LKTVRNPKLFSSVCMHVKSLQAKQTLSDVSAMSALPPKADIKKRCWDVRFVSKADSHCNKKGLLFDQLVGARKHGSGNGEAERFGSLEVDYQFELGRLLDRELGRSRAL